MTYQEALKGLRKIGASRASNAEALAGMCEALPAIYGAVSPQLIWEGALARGMTVVELAAYLRDGGLEACDALMWGPA